MPAQHRILAAIGVALVAVAVVLIVGSVLYRRRSAAA